MAHSFTGASGNYNQDPLPVDVMKDFIIETQTILQNFFFHSYQSDEVVKVFEEGDDQEHFLEMGKDKYGQTVTLAEVMTHFCEEEIFGVVHVFEEW